MPRDCLILLIRAVCLFNEESSAFVGSNWYMDQLSTGGVSDDATRYALHLLRLNPSAVCA